MQRPILIIHPHDKTTSFLDKIKNHLIRSFGDNVHHFNIYPNDDSHNQCLDRIRAHDETGIIIFLGHGRTNKLYGSKGDAYENVEFVSAEAIEAHPDSYYNNDNFINEENIDVFKERKVICLACNSNSHIATWALERGATAFMGFGNIPTSFEEFEDDGLVNIGNDIVKMMKSEVNYIIKRSIEIAISKNYSFRELRDIIHFITSQRISHYLRIDKSSKVRFILVDYLFLFKSNIKILGDYNVKILR